MLSIDILISVTNNRIVRIKEALPQPQEGIRYIISYQYQSEKHLSLIPKELENYPDVTLIKNKNKGLSNSRNNALQYSTGDLVYFIDDDTIILPEAFDKIRDIFENNPNIDIALFQAQNYSGNLLREYKSTESDINKFSERYHVLAYETVCRRDKINGLSYNPLFGLGSGVFICFEQQIFLEDAIRKNLNIKYFPTPICQTSAILKPHMIFVDSHVQKALGGLFGYIYGFNGYLSAIAFAWRAHRVGKGSFLKLLKNLAIGLHKTRTIF